MILRTLSMCALVATAAFSQDSGPGKAALHQRVGEIKNSIAKNQAQLKQYAWTETTQISLKGEVKKVDQNACSYGPDGKVQKTPVTFSGVQREFGCPKVKANKVKYGWLSPQSISPCLR